MATVSIGIPTWRRAELTRVAIASVLNQDYAGIIECCVYVDGPDPETRLLLKRLSAALGNRSDIRDQRRLIWSGGDENRGIAYAKNAALRLGTGQLRGILDSDDVYDKRFVSRCVAELEAHPEVVCVYTDNYRTQPNRHTRALEEAEDWSIEALLRCRLRGDCYLARWDAFERAGLHDERFELEVDYDAFFALAAVGPLRRIPEPLMTVTAHDGQTTKDRTRAAYWHAAGLGKYGHSIEWAMRRAERHPEWHEAIRAGYVFGKGLRHAPR